MKRLLVVVIVIAVAACSNEKLEQEAAEQKRHAIAEHQFEAELQKRGFRIEAASVSHDITFTLGHGWLKDMSMDAKIDHLSCFLLNFQRSYDNPSVLFLTNIFYVRRLSNGVIAPAWLEFTKGNLVYENPTSESIEKFLENGPTKICVL